MIDGADNIQEQDFVRTRQENLFDCDPPEAAAGNEPYFWNLRAGNRDPLHNVVLKTIQTKSQSFIVYIDEHINLQWAWSGKVDQRTGAAIFNRLNELEAKVDFLREAKQQSDFFYAKSLIGERLVRFLLTQDPGASKKALDIAERFINQKAKETSRIWYFLPYFWCFCVSVIVVGASCFRPDDLIVKYPIGCVFAGGVGAFISSVMRNDRIPWAASAGRGLHRLEATLRWSVGLTAGLLIWFLTNGDVLIGFLKAHPDPFALIAASLLAGASERFLPTFIQKFDQAGAPSPDAKQGQAGGTSGD